MCGDLVLQLLVLLLVTFIPMACVEVDFQGLLALHGSVYSVGGLSHFREYLTLNMFLILGNLGHLLHYHVRIYSRFSHRLGNLLNILFLG